MKKELLNKLSACLTPERHQRFLDVVAQRSRHITVALEDIYQPHNASAVLRTCDCFGVQDLHIIENRNEYLVNPEVALGSSQWLNLHRYNQADMDNSKRCAETLRRKGYRLVATSPHVDGYSPENLPLNQPVAILLGTEGKGLSDYLLAEADMQLRVPMYGFTESFNISVSAAMIVHRLTERVRQENIDFLLTEEEQDEVLFQWMRHSVKGSEELIRSFESSQ